MDDIAEKREIKPTEKIIQYKLELKQTETLQLLKSLTASSKDFQGALSETEDPEDVQPLYTDWLSRFDQLLSVNEQCLQLISDEGEKATYKAWFDKRIEGFQSLNNYAHEWFSKHPKTQADDNKSRITTRSSSRSSSLSSHLSAARLKEEQRKAELLIRAKALDEKKALEEEKLKLKLKEEALDIKTELGVSDAKSKVIDELERSMMEDQLLEEKLFNQETSIQKPNQFISFDENVEKFEFQRPETQQTVPKKSNLNPNVDSFVPQTTKPAIDNNDVTATQFRTDNRGLINNIQTSKPLPSNNNEASMVARELNKPKVEIQKFDGNPMDYNRFLRQFNSRIVENTSSYEEQLTYLLQYTTGEPKRIATGYSHLDAQVGYKAALNEFKERYGDSNVIAQAYVKRALDWPLIKHDNSKALDDFAIFLKECQYAVETVQAAAVLEYSDNLKHLVKKLPFHLHEKWRNIVYETKERKGVITFEKLVNFVRKEAKKANDPIYGKDVLSSSHSSNKKAPERSLQPRPNFATLTDTSQTQRKSQQNVEPIGTNMRIAYNSPCIFCKNSVHGLVRCDAIVKKDLKDRYQFIRTQGLCFGCLKSGHNKSSCKHKHTCNICKRSHPTILHVEPRQENSHKLQSYESGKEEPPQVQASATQAHIGAGDSSLLSQALPIVPVRLNHMDSDKYVETYAFLDSCSTATFCSENIIRSLNLIGKKTKLSLVTMGQSTVQDCYMVSGLEICNLHGDNVISLPPVFSQETLPVTSNDIVRIEHLQRWSYLRDIPLERIESDHVGLLIGINVPRAMEPWNVVPSEGNGPFAVETLLGWVINGPLNVTSDVSPRKLACNRINAVSLEDQLRNQFNHDFNEKTIDDVLSPSKEDHKFLELVSKSIMLKDGHYVIDLPFKSKDNTMPNNRRQAEQRLKLLGKRFEKDKKFCDEYIAFMGKVIGEGYASEVSVDDIARSDGHIWFLPHHGVFHPRKQKIRVVFDCAARFQGTSLNECLLQGPNLTNTLIGTLIRFRQHEIAIIGDIDSMFHQVCVPKEDANYLRFLWWKDGNTNNDPIEYQMNVHLFGATSSSSCVNYALRKTAEDGKGHFNDEVISTVLRNFYVDDCLKSVSSVSKAVGLVEDLQFLLSRGGFRIAKWISNNRDVMRSIPTADMAKEVMDLDLDQDSLPIDRALGIQWCAETDTFRFKISVKEQPKTRRGILSMVSSVYDPLGFLAPFVLRAKIILQELCRLHLDWDDPIPPKLEALFTSWFQDLHELSDFRVERCFRQNRGELRSAQLHNFADASENGYGIVTYLRTENAFGEVQCSFVIGKARVTPLKPITIPRLELTAATVAVRTNKMLLKELEIPIDRSFFWTDSMSVLLYIRNEDTRFQTFVANRLTVIHEGSEIDDWRYVNTKLNPADYASRGLTSSEMKTRNWIKAPDFLWRDKDSWPKSPSDICDKLCEDDPEVKRATVRTVIKTEQNDNQTGVQRLINHHSSWMSLKRSVAWILRVRETLLERVKRQKLSDKATHYNSSKLENYNQLSLSLQDIKNAEHAILVFVQRQEFNDEICTLASNKSIKVTSNIRKLDQILDGDILRVGGRLVESSMPENSKHPVILPKGHHVSELILRQLHVDLKHAGRNHLLACLRENYWLINAPAAVRKLVSKCVVCRRLSAPVGEQKMANLPADRISPDDPPFTNVGVDYFGLFEVKQRRCRIKRYGCIFTCLSSRAIHLEVAASLDTSSYINVLRRFIARRGQVERIRSDNGTNFVGAEHELKNAIDQWNLNQIEHSMLQRNVDWKFNPPAGSHFGGIWERLIRSVRRTLNSVVREQILDDDGLSTIFCEIQSTLNSRPITINSDDPKDLEALTPNHLLLMKRKLNLPPGLFTKTDNYCRRRWRQIQYMANLFWSRWVREYLPMLQERQKWHKEKRNLIVGNIVVVVDSNAPRNSWPLGRVTETISDNKGLVRQVKLKIGDNILRRPVDKLCTLLEFD